MGNWVGMLAKRRQKQDEDLLPGIFHHVVLDKIVPKLHWKDVYRLSSVSRAWNNAVRSRQVFDSRVLFNSSPDTVIGCYSGTTIALYSIRENSWYLLPPIAPSICLGKPGVPEFAQCISMDRKIYVLGGSINYRLSEKVFVFDLAGGGKWKRCASMEQRRQVFGSIVKDGKIYVFGGRGETLILNSEVYDPKENTWSRIRRTTTSRYGHDVTQVGQALCIYGGWNRIGYGNNHADSLEAYDPFKDEWRVLRHHWNRREEGVVFSAQGNVFSIQQDYTPRNFRLDSYVIDKYDVHENCWIRVHSFSFVAVTPLEYNSGLVHSSLYAILPVDDEIIALVTCCPKAGTRREGLCVFQSTGFSSKKQNISWKLIAITFEQPEAVNLARRQQYFVQLL